VTDGVHPSSVLMLVASIAAMIDTLFHLLLEPHAEFTASFLLAFDRPGAVEGAGHGNVGGQMWQGGEAIQRKVELMASAVVWVRPRVWR
jgi:hypothetical protein